MDCKEAQILLAPHIMGDLDSDSRSHELEVHLFSCQACSQEYKAIKETMEFIDEHKALFAEAFETIDKKRAAEQEDMKRNWQGIEAKLDKIEAQERKGKRTAAFRTLWKVAAAACLVIGVSVWLVVLNPKTPEKRVSRQIPSPLATAIKIELLSNSGSTPLPAGRDISTSADELKTLLINGRHRLVMKADSTLAIEPFEQDGHLGCMVRLSLGEIFAHVEHNGNPFVVSTTHGRAVITGTTFDIKTTNDSTMLVVAEGTVHFGSEEGFVEVTAGHTSKIAGQSAPTKPAVCNTAELTSWTTGYEPGPALAQTESNTDLSYLPLSLRKEPIILEEADYDHWVEQKRNWFEQQFPWKFQLKDALAKEDIEVDYPELLLKTGDVWRFVCLEISPARFSVIDPNSLLKTASDYGFDKQWLLENVPAAKSVLEKPVPSKNYSTGLKAFDQWLKYFDKAGELEPPTPIYSYHASKYLAETRSLIWFAVKDGKYDLTAEECAEVLFLLQEEVTAAYECQNGELYPPDKLKLSCSEDKCQELIDSIVGYIETMKAVEERIAGYIIKINECEKGDFRK